MGALISIIPNVYVGLLLKKNLLDKQLMITDIISLTDFENILSPLFEVNLKNELDNEFSKGSGQGLVRKLAVAMWKQIVQTIPNYLDFHKSYIDWFNKTIIEKS